MKKKKKQKKEKNSFIISARVEKKWGKIKL